MRVTGIHESIQLVCKGGMSFYESYLQAVVKYLLLTTRALEHCCVEEPAVTLPSSNHVTSITITNIMRPSGISYEEECSGNFFSGGETSCRARLLLVWRVALNPEQLQQYQN
jgi:hypothetical protein